MNTAISDTQSFIAMGSLMVGVGGVVLAGVSLFVALVIGGAIWMWKLYKISKRFGQVATREDIEAVRDAVTTLDTRINGLDNRITAVDTRIDGMRVAVRDAVITLDNRMDGIDRSIKERNYREFANGQQRLDRRNDSGYFEEMNPPQSM